MPRNSRTVDRVAVFFVVAVLGCVAATTVLLRVLHQRTTDRVVLDQVRGMQQERRRERDVVKRELEGMATLDEQEKARRLWRLWLTIVDERWDYALEQQQMLIPELQALGDSAFEVLLDEIRNGTGFHAHEASEHLAIFGERATYALIELLDTGDEQSQRAALSGLWYCSVRQGLSGKEREVILAALRPMLTSTEAWRREGASAVSRVLEQ